MSRRSAAITFVMLVGLCLSSCLNSQQPLSNPLQAQLDETLLGTWLLRDESTVSYYHVGKANDKKVPAGWFRVIGAEFDRNQELGVTDALGFATVIDDYRYLNLIVGDAETFDPTKMAEARWLIFQYEIKGDRGTLRFVGSGFVEQQIRDGKIKGQIEAKQGETILTGSTAKIAAWVAANRQQIFTDAFELRRVQLAP